MKTKKIQMVNVKDKEAMFIDTIVFMSMVCLILSCASTGNVWTKPNFTKQEFATDKYECMQESQQQSSSAYVNRYGGIAESGSIMNSSLFNACMEAHGWSLVSEEQQKINSVKRKEDLRHCKDYCRDK